MRTKVLVEKKSFKHTAALMAHLLNAALLCSAREMCKVKVYKSSVYRAELKLQTGKAVSCVDIGNIVKGKRHPPFFHIPICSSLELDELMRTSPVSVHALNRSSVRRHYASV